MDSQTPFGATGSLYGYIVQETLMLNHLLDANDDDIISMEYFDDLAVETSSGQVKAIQSKSARTWNPVSDKSKDFWKTISNWISIAESGLVDPNNTKFIIAMTKKREGKLSNLFKLAKTESDFQSVIEYVANNFRKAPNSIANYINKFLNSDQAIVGKIVINFGIEIYEDPKQIILDKLRKHEDEKNVEKIFDMLTGWLKNKIEDAVKDGNPPFIACQEFRKQRLAIRRDLDQRYVLKSYATNPKETEMREHLTHVYVKQLELIDCDFDEKIEAISDYIKARTDRIHWAEDGDILKSSLDEFYTSLVKTWKNEKRKVEVINSDKSPDLQGKIVLYECYKYRTPLAGKEIPSHFIPGCFHDCSNQLTLGWHPDYLALLTNGEGNAR